MSDYELNLYLNSQEPDDTFTGYDDDSVLEDACRKPSNRATWQEREMANVLNLAIADVYAMDVAPMDTTCELEALAPVFAAYDAWDYHTSAEADMKWEMDKRKRWFEARMKQWKLVLEMSERGELR